MSMKAVYVVTKCVGTKVSTMSMFQEAYVCESDAINSVNRFLKSEQSDATCSKLESGSFNYSGRKRSIEDGITVDTDVMFQVRVDTLGVDEYDLQDYEQDFMVELELKQVYHFTVKVRAADEDLAQALAIEKANDGDYEDEYNANYPDDAECDVVYCEEA